MVINPAEFRKELQTSIDSGASVIPLVGSGLSVASGIPAGQEFTNYLTYAMYKCFEANWDLENSGWPPIPKEDELLLAANWYSEKRQELHDPSRLKPAQILIREGLGCLGDWRSTLIFLSRLRSKQPPLDEIVARSPKLSVIDAFNVFITRGKRFNMGHKMLAYLAPVMGTRLVLTTNFDNLIEQAFSALRSELVVFNVSIAGRLPDYRVVRSQPSLIKLHGGMSETRADFSLDEEPTEIDKDQFLNYVRPTWNIKNITKHGAPACLLVIGFSGRDRRIVDFIKHALKEANGLDGKRSDASIFKVFWIAFTEDDSSRICREFHTERDGGFVHVMQTLRPDLFLLELYHDLTYCLPPGGLPFSLSSRVPPYPGVTPSINSSDWCSAEDFETNKRNLLTAIERENPAKTPYICEGTFGVSSVASAVYWALLDKHKKCVWLDLEDYYNAATLEAQLLKTLCNRRGLLELETVTLAPIPHIASRTQETDIDYKRIINYLKIRPKEWYVFLNGRYELGASASIDKHHWLVEQEVRLHKMLTQLAANGFNVVYLPPSKPAATYPANQFLPITKQFKDDALDRIIQSTLQWTLRPTPHIVQLVDTIRHKEHFLYAIALCRQSRHLSLLSSEAVFPVPERFLPLSDKDYDKWRGEIVREWVNELTEIGLLRFKPGGFYSLRTSARIKLISLLTNPEEIKDVSLVQCVNAIKHSKSQGTKPLGRSLREVGARIHHWIAEWYLKAFRVTHDSMAFIECLHHRYMCLLEAEHTMPPAYLIAHCRQNHELSRDETIAHFRLQMARVALSESIKLLRMSGPIIKSEIELTMAERIFSIDKLRDRILRLSIKPQGHAASWKDFVEPWLDLWDRENAFLLNSIKDEAGIILYRRLGTLDHNVLKPKANVSHPAKTLETAHETDFLVSEKDFDFVLNLKKKEFNLALRHVKQRLVKCGIDDAMAEAMCRKNIEIQELRSYLFYWIASQAEQQRSKLLRLLLQTFILLLEIKVQTSKVSQDLSSLTGAKQGGDVRAQWYDIAVLAGAFIRLSWHLSPEEVDLQNTFHITVRSLLGLSFAYLGKFYESHRRYQEASAFLANATTSSEIVTWGMLDARRAESLICEATFTREQNAEAAKEFRILACLDDAWEALEKAERAFAGRSRSVWWWGRLSILKLRIFKELALSGLNDKMMPLADRTLLDRRDHIHQILDKALLLNPRDVVRTSRLADHYMEALPEQQASRDYIKQLQIYLDQDVKETQSLHSSIDPDRNNVIAFANAVLLRLEKRLMYVHT